LKRILVSTLAMASFALGGGVCRAQQTPPPMSSQRLEFNVTSLNGLPLHGQARGIEGLMYTSAVSVTTMDGKSELHRLIIDETHHLYFGYDLEAFRVEGAQQVHLHFSPLSTLSSFRGIDVTNCRPGDLLTPPDQTVDINVSFEVPLERSPQGDTVLRDKLTFGPPDGTP